MSNKLCEYLDHMIDIGAEVQVGLRGSPQPMGPARVERVSIEKDGSVRDVDGLYRMLVPAQMQATPNSKPTVMLIPLVFSGDDILVVLEAPLNVAGEKAVIPLNGGRTPGGLHIPGS